MQHARPWAKIRNCIATICHVVTTLVVILLAALAVSWVNLGHEWDGIVKSPGFPNKALTAQHWQKSVEGIRIHESKSYVESIMGIPQLSSTRQTKEIGRREKCVVNYELTTHINEFFSLHCVYIDDTLKGFLVISSNDGFRPLNYRTGFTCLDDTIATAAERCDSLKMYNMCIMANMSNRIDNNAFYMECKEQHPYEGGDFILIGYGVCDIGLWPADFSIYSELSKDAVFGVLLDRRIMAGNEVAALVGGSELVPDEVNAITHSRNLDIRNQRINAFFVFDDSKDYSYELLFDSLMTGTHLGMNRDKYSSFITDYPRGFLPTV